MNYLHFSEIHKDDVLYEEGPEISLQIVVLDEPAQDRDQWTFNANTSFGITRYLMTDGFSHYGPRLSREPTRFSVQTVPGETLLWFEVRKGTQ